MTRSLRGDDGANAVEFALVLPILVVLIFGGIWGGIAINHDLSLSTATREGARYAATLLPATTSGTPPVPDDDWFEDVLDRVEAETAGSLGAGVPEARICVSWIGSTNVETAVQRTWPGGDTIASSGCGVSDGLTDQTRVQVTTERRSDIQAVLVNVPVRVHSEAVARYEREVTS